MSKSKILVNLAIFFCTFYNFSMDKKDDQERQELIKKNTVLFVDIVKPGFQSLFAGAKAQPKILLAPQEVKVTSLILSPCGTFFIIADTYKTLTLYELANPKKFKVLLSFYEDDGPSLESIDISQCGKFAAGGFSNNRILLIDLTKIDYTEPAPNCKIIELQEGNGEDNISCQLVKISNKGEFLVSSSNKAVKLWPIKNVDWFGNAPAKIEPLLLYLHNSSNKFSEVTSLDISKSGKFIVIGCSNSIVIADTSKFDMADVELIALKTVEYDTDTNLSDRTFSAVVSKDEKFIVSTRSRFKRITDTENYPVFETQIWLLQDVTSNNKKVRAINIDNYLARNISSCGKFLIGTDCTPIGKTQAERPESGLRDDTLIKELSDANCIDNFSQNGQTFDGHNLVTHSVMLDNQGKFFIVAHSDNSVTLYELNIWIFNDLNNVQIKQLVNLLAKDTNDLIDCYNKIKHLYSKNFNYYIEKYIRKRILDSRVCGVSSVPLIISTILAYVDFSLNSAQ